MIRQLVPPAPARALRRALTLAPTLALTLAACGGEGETTEPAATPTIAGVYPLRSVNGTALPLVVERSATEGTTELTGGQVALREDGSFNESMTFRLTPPGVGAVATTDSLSSRGRYTTNATRAQITFTFPDGQVVTAGFTDGTITVTGQATFVYRR